MANHYENEKSHCVCLSMMDLSFWCFECDTYVFNKTLQKLEDIVSKQKFPEDFVPTTDNLTESLEKLNLDEKKSKSVKYDMLLDLLNKKQCITEY